VESYRLSYADLKRMARQSLEHSFLPGQSLWTDTKLVFRPAQACASDAAGAEKPSAACEHFLAANERARTQWNLESEFAKFEKKY
jgi:adenosine deaminase